MHKFPIMVGFGLGAILLLGGCVTTQSPAVATPVVYVGPPIVTEGSPSWIKAAQSYVAQRCGQFYPTAETIRRLFASGDPTLQTLSGLAAAICNAIQPAPAVVAVEYASAPMRRSVVSKSTYQAKAKVPTATGDNTVKLIKVEGRRI